MTTCTPKFLRAALAALACVFSLLLLPAALAADARKSFDIPAGEALPALKRFAAQSGEQLLYSAEVVQGVKTNAVNGSFTPREALEKMISDTKLVVVADRKNGALSLVRADDPNAQRAAQNSDRPTSPSKVEGGKLVLDKYEVTGRRIDGLNNKGLLQGGADAPLYHDVVTRQDIERMGVTSLEELFRLIPQTSSATTSFQGMANTNTVTGGMTTRSSTMGLRGFDSAQTVLLINGRALPRTNLSNSGGADLSRIPLAAIERVEILPYAGSAIYGAGAIGGAVNIILRREYTGKELTTYVGTTTEGGGTEYKITYLDGRSFHGGRGNITTTFSYQHRDEVRMGDRGFLADAYARFNPQSYSGLRDGAQRIPFESMLLPLSGSAPGIVVLNNAPTAAINELGIPGAAGVRWALIPAGTTAASSASLTPSSFTPITNSGQISPRVARNILYEPIDAYSINSQVEYEIFKDKLSAYGEFTFGYNRKHYTFPQALSQSLSATDPLNPFRTGVTPGFAGRAVTVYYDAIDIPDPTVIFEDDTARAVMGLKGRFSEAWEWTVDGTVDYAHARVRSNNPPDNLRLLQALDLSFDSFPGPPAPVATRRAIYPLLADHRQNPISAADADKYFYSVRDSGSHGVLTEGNARVTGDAFELPAGPLRVSAFGKYQNWETLGGQAFSGSDAWSQLIHGVPFASSATGNDSHREIWQGAVELSIPVIGEKWRPIPVDGFEIQASASREKDMSGGTNFNGDPFGYDREANSNVLAAKLQLTRDIAFRASYSEGYYPPNWVSIGNARTPSAIPGVFADPLRGNTTQGTDFIVNFGGNPSLRSETAESQNYGVIFTPRFVPGLTVSVDYWKIEKVDAITNVSFTTAISNPAVFGFAVTRAPATPAEQALGWAGLILEVENAPVNASQVATEGLDSRIRYQRDLGSLGRITINANAAFTNHFYLKITPTAPIVNTAGGSGPVRWRGNLGVTWNRDPWGVSVNGRYVGHYSTNTTRPSSSFPNAIAYDGGRIPAYLHWDTQVTYDIPASSVGSGWKQWMTGTRLTLGVNNILNEAPSFVTSAPGFYNTYDDPRQRFVYFSIRKYL